MGAKPSNTQIAGVALLLFSSVLLGVGIHHMIATGTCSSTGYSANYGPVPHCPSGTGWWFAFLFGGIFGSLAGAFMAQGIGLVFAGIFGGIGFGALTILFDSSAQSSTKLFGAIFGGCFAVVGVIAWIAVIRSALGSLRTTHPNPAAATPSPTPSMTSSAFGTPQATSAFGSSVESSDPILSAYNASRSESPSPAGTATAASPTVPSPTPLNLVPGLQAAAQHAASGTALEELSKLADLHKKGALTDAEFASAKARVLGQI